MKYLFWSFLLFGLCTVFAQLTDEHYDFIVIGSGAGGSVMAGRLSENPNFRVLLLESGSDIDGAYEEQPFLFPNSPLINFHNPYLRHCYSNESVPSTTSQFPGFYYYPARCMGGATSLHTLFYARFSSEDLSQWNMPYWTQKQVRPYSNKLETYNNLNNTLESMIAINSNLRGGSGPFVVQQYPGGPLTSALFNALKETFNVPFNVDNNLDDNFGISQHQRSASGTADKPVRSTVYDAYIKPYINGIRPNLVVRPLTTATKLLIGGHVDMDGNKEVYGVNFVQEGQSCTAYASKEIIVSASILNSPKLLLLSGIGDADYLNSMKIPVHINSKNVGLNLRDKLTFSPLLYLAPNTSLVIDGPIPGLFYNDGVEPSDTRAVNTVYYVIPQRFSLGVLFGINPEIVYTTCNGSVRLLDKDPFSEVKFQLNCYQPGPGGSLSPDLMHQLKAFKDTRRLMSNFAQILGQPLIELTPGLQQVPATATDEQIIQYIMSTSTITFQPGGTCCTGLSIEDSVVDQYMKVWGTNNLRVVDVSVLPNVMQGPPSGGAMAISERIASKIKQFFNLNL